MSFGGDLDNNDEIMNEINMTPLVDVMLVLLIIFIITLPVLTHSVQIDLPRAQNIPTVEQPKSITVSLTRTGDIFWNDQPIEPADFTARLQATAAERPQPQIDIRGDRKVEYENVLHVMAQVQKAGILKLGFVTEPGTP